MISDGHCCGRAHLCKSGAHSFTRRVRNECPMRSHSQAQDTTTINQGATDELPSYSNTTQHAIRYCLTANYKNTSTTLSVAIVPSALFMQSTRSASSKESTRICIHRKHSVQSIRRSRCSYCVSGPAERPKVEDTYLSMRPPFIPTFAPP